MSCALFSLMLSAALAAQEIAWCAVSARPDSLMMSGCAMPFSSHACCTANTTSFAYSCSE